MLPPARAFTLIELVAVILLMAIMAALAAPALGTLPGAARDAAALNLRRDLAFAREHALSTGDRTWVAFAIDTQSYTLRAEPRTSPSRAAALVITDPATGAPMIQRLDRGPYAGIRLLSVSAGGAAELGFDRLGRPLSVAATPLTADALITLTGPVTIRVRAGTGLASRDGAAP